ncbi:MAG: UDP-N-acetylglucosamine 1-carboxyvinyltransferase [Terriglobales bacterium]
MDKLVIRGGVPLAGEVRISGAKNAALPAMAACLLTSDTVILDNIPEVRDIQTTRRLLETMGVDADLGGGRARHRVNLRADPILHPEAPYELVKTMRASTLVLGPLLARTGQARVSLPGGCAIGARPIDLHLKGLEALGAVITQEHGYVIARAERLRGARYAFERVTVTGTEDVLMAATLAEGETILENCAQEPEVADLAALLAKMGAKISGAGTPVITVQGVARLHGAQHHIIPDRIEAGTFLLAGLITGGALTLTQCQPAHLEAVFAALRAAGAEITVSGETVRARPGPGLRQGRLRATDISTAEYPGFATDLQAQYMALMTQAEGDTVITETIFENRYMHALELNRMGANIRLDGRRAVVHGPAALSGAAVLASDLRASASLVLAALAAEGETIIDRIYHLDRGYERLEEKLRAVGAAVRRVGNLIPTPRQRAAGGPAR